MKNFDLTLKYLIIIEFMYKKFTFTFLVIKIRKKNLFMWIGLIEIPFCN